jgi:hypothetical protein
MRAGDTLLSSPSERCMAISCLKAFDILDYDCFRLEPFEEKNTYDSPPWKCSTNRPIALSP